MQQIQTISEHTSTPGAVTWNLDPTGYGFHLTRGMLLSIPMYRPVASQLLIDGSFASVRVTLIQTPASVLRHTWPVIRTVDTARVEYVTIKSHK